MQKMGRDVNFNRLKRFMDQPPEKTVIDRDQTEHQDSEEPGADTVSYVNEIDSQGFVDQYRMLQPPQIDYKSDDGYKKRPKKKPQKESTSQQDQNSEQLNPYYANENNQNQEELDAQQEAQDLQERQAEDGKLSYHCPSQIEQTEKYMQGLFKNELFVDREYNRSIEVEPHPKNIQNIQTEQYPDRGGLNDLTSGKTEGTQTTSGYDLIPQVIMFNLQSKVYDMINDQTREFKQRQLNCDNAVKENSQLMLKLNEKVREVEYQFKREKNILDELVKVDAKQIGQADEIKGLYDAFRDVSIQNAEKLKQFQQKMDAQKTSVEQELKRMTANEMSEAKVDKLFQGYTKNILEKFQQLTGSFTDEICRLEGRYRTISDMINHNNVSVGDCKKFVQAADIRFAKLEFESERVGKAMDVVEPLVMDFDQRIISIQKQLDNLTAKQDLEMANMVHQITDSITKDDTYRMIYNFNADQMKFILDPEKHYSKKSGKQRINPAIQTLSNFYDWQIHAADFQYRDLMNHHLDKTLDNKGVQLENTKILRGKAFRLQANADKYGHKLKRRHSIEGVKGTLKDLEKCIYVPKPAVCDSDGEPYSTQQTPGITQTDFVGPQGQKCLKDYVAYNMKQQAYDLYIAQHPPKRRRHSNYIGYKKRDIDKLYIEPPKKEEAPNFALKFNALGSTLKPPGLLGQGVNSQEKLQALHKIGSSSSIMSHQRANRPSHSHRPNRDRGEREKPEKSKHSRRKRENSDSKDEILSPRSAKADTETPRRNKKQKRRGSVRPKDSSSESSKVSTARDHTSDRKSKMRSSHTSDLLGKNLKQKTTKRERDQQNISVLSSKRGSSESEIQLKQKTNKKIKQDYQEVSKKRKSTSHSRIRQDSEETISLRRDSHDKSELSLKEQRKSPDKPKSYHKSQSVESKQEVNSPAKLTESVAGKNESRKTSERDDSPLPIIQEAQIEQSLPNSPERGQEPEETKRQEKRKSLPKVVEQEENHDERQDSEAARSVKSRKNVHFKEKPNAAEQSDQEAGLDSSSEYNEHFQDIANISEEQSNKTLPKQKTQKDKKKKDQNSSKFKPIPIKIDKESEASPSYQEEDDDEETEQSASEAFSSENDSIPSVKVKKQRGEARSKKDKKKKSSPKKKKDSSSEDGSSSGESGSGDGSGSDSVDSQDLRESIQKVCRNMLKAYPSKEDMYKEIDYLRDDIRQEMIDDMKPIFEEMTLEMIQTQVGESTQTLAQLIQETANQINLGTDAKLEKERQATSGLFEKVKTQVVPAAITIVERKMQEQDRKQKENTLETEARILEAMKQYTEDLAIFDAKLNGTSIKFHKLIQTTDAFRIEVKTIQDKMNLKLDILHNELQALANMTSTLVELEFVQQSLDFQDEVDKTKLHLFGLSDATVSMDDLAAKTGVSAVATGGADHHHLKRNNNDKNDQMEKNRHKNKDANKSGLNTTQLVLKGKQPEPEEIEQEHPIAIMLSDECLGCGDPRIKKKINAAFKLACVQYKPSWVLYRGHKFQRKKLIEAKRQILDAEWRIMLQYEPFKALFGECPHETFSTHLVEKLQTFSGTSRDKIIRMQKLNQDSTVSTQLEGGSSFLDTSNKLNQNIQRLTKDVAKQAARQPQEIQVQTQQVKPLYTEANTTIQPQPLGQETDNSIAQIAPQSTIQPNSSIEPTPEKTINNQPKSPQDSMLMLIDKLDGAGSTIVDAQDFEQSPQLASSTKHGSPIQEVQREDQAKKPNVILNETNYSKKIIVPSGVAKGAGERRYKEQRSLRNNKMNESVFSSGPNEDLMSSLQKQSPSFDDQFGNLPSQNLSIIASDPPQMNYQESFAESKMDFNPGYASQGQINKDKSSPLSNAKLMAKTRYEPQEGQDSRNVKQQMNQTAIQVGIQKRGSSLKLEKTKNHTQDQALISMRQLVGKDASPTNSPRVGTNTTAALRGIISHSRDRVEALNKSTKDQRQQLIEAARMRKGKGSGGGGTWNHKKPDRTGYGKSRPVPADITSTEFFVGGGMNPVLSPQDATSVNHMYDIVNVSTQHNETPKLGDYPYIATNNMISHESMTRDQLNDIGRTERYEYMTSGILDNLRVERSEALQTKQLQLPQLNQVKVEPMTQKSNKVARKNFKAQTTHTSQETRGTPVPNPKESITVNALVAVRRGAGASSNQVNSNRDDIQTAHAASQNAAFRQANNPSPCTCPPDDYENDGNEYIPTATEMLRELDAVGQAGTQFQQDILINVKSSTRNYEQRQLQSHQHQSTQQIAERHHKVQTQVGAYPIRLKSPSSESMLSNQFFETRHGAFPPIQPQENFGPTIVSSQQKQIDKRNAPHTEMKQYHR